MTKTKAHVAVLDPGQNTPELDAFNRLTARYPDYQFSYHLPALQGMDSIFDLDTPPNAIILFGSGASVLDQEPWQIAMNDWLKTKLEEAVPCLGICYGHQLLAHLFGCTLGYVHPSKAKELGLRQVRAKGCIDNPSLQHGPLLVSHRECVTVTSPSCEILASSSLVTCEIFRHRQLPAWGIQAHPEAGPGFLRNQSIAVQEPAEAYRYGGLWIAEFFQACLKT